MKSSENKVEDLRKRCLDNFASFCILFTDPGFFDVNFHTQVCVFLQREDGVRKLVVLPRSFLKTTIVCLYMLWRAVKNPEIRILYTTNTAENAGKKLQYLKHIIENNRLFSALFPEIIPDFGKVRWSTEGLELNREGSYPESTFEGAGTGTAVIGRHYNIIVEDDTIAPEKDKLTGEELMPSQEMVSQAIGWHKLAMPLLVNPTDEIIVCGTRWYAHDLIHHVMEKETSSESSLAYKVLDRPAFIDDNNEKPAYHRYSKDVLDAYKDSLGTYMFNALYLNKPLESSQLIFLPEWIKKTEDEMEGGELRITVDPAIGDKKGHDYSVVLLARHYESEQRKYMLVEDFKRGTLKPFEILDAIFEYNKKWGVFKVRVESVMYQKMLITMLREEASKKGVPLVIQEFNSKQKKETWIQNLAPLFESGRLLIRPWMRMLESELLEFPYGAHDDIIDALAMQLADYLPIYMPPPASKQEVDNPYAPKFEDVLNSIQRNKHRGDYAYI